MTRAVLWDLDDTLLDTLPARMRALAYAYETCLGETTDPLALWRSTRGGTLEALGRRLLGDGFRRFTTVYRECYYGSSRAIRAYDGIRPALEQLRIRGVPMAVVTSKVSWGAIEELEAAELLEYFGAVVGFDDTDAHKPDPEPVHEALDRLLVHDAAGVLFVGDSPADVFAARNAGCRSVAATWGTLDDELLRDAYPDFIADHPLRVLGVMSERMGALR